MKKPVESGIYQVRNKINGKVYVGSAVNLCERKTEHFCGSNSSKYLQNSIKKHGKDNFVFEVLEIVKNINKDDNFSYLYEREQHYLDIINPCNHLIGYNLSMYARSGMKGRHHSDETKKKIGIGNTGKVVSNETKKKLSIINSGINSPKYGTHHSDETKKKISVGNIGRIVSDETKKKLSLCMIGKPSLNLGKKMTNEQKNKISKSLIGNIPVNRKKIIINSILYNSLAEAADILNLCCSTIYYRINSINFNEYKYY